MSTYIPSTAPSPAKILPTSSEQTTGGIKIEARTHVPKTQAPEDSLLPPQALGWMRDSQSVIICSFE